MRIGMMTDNYKTHISGVTNTISLVKRFLEFAGHEVFIFTFDKNDSTAEENDVIYSAGIPVTDFYINFHYSQPAKELLSTMDIVHVHHPFVSGYIARRYCLPENIPIVFTNHSRYELMTQAYVPFLPSSIIDAGIKSYLTNFFQICDLVIIPSASMHQVLLKYLEPGIPVEIIPPGLDFSVFQGNNQPVDRQVFGLTSDHVICVYVGRLSPEKNIPFLLTAFNEAVRSNANLRLLLIGDGPLRADLETQVIDLELGSKVIMTGLLPYKEIPRYLSASDFFATPSMAESFGLSTLEAMAAGIPAVGINSPGTSDIIEDGVNGLISNPDMADFTEKLLRVSLNLDLRRDLGKNAVLSARKYDIRETTSKLIQHYERLIEASKRRKLLPI